MRTRFFCKKKKYMAVLTVAVSAVVALPILLFPLGLGIESPAYITVQRAYAAAYPTDPNETEVLIEDYAIRFTDDDQSIAGIETEDDVVTEDPTDTSSEETVKPGTIDPDTGLLVLAEGQTVSASYLDGETPTATDAVVYDNIMTATVEQSYDEAQIPIELLDPTTFTPDGGTYYIQTSDTIIKESPDMASVTLATINKGKGITRVSVGDTWSLIQTEDGVTGYVPNTNITDQMIFIAIDRTVWVDTSGLKLRADPSTQAEIITTLSKNEKLHCLAVSDKWYQVELEDGTEGYVYISYTTQTRPPDPTATPTPRRTSSSSGSGSGSSGSTAHITGVNGESIVSICQSMLGVQYTYASATREEGVDCSGLVVYAYRQIGIELPHQSNSLTRSGMSVSRADIQIGDIVCWDVRGSSSTAEHVGIYVGNGQVIHASSTRDRVEYGKLDMYPIVAIRRIIS